MRQIIFFSVFCLFFSVLSLSVSAGNPQIVQINPSEVDINDDEPVFFDGECVECDSEVFEYFYWNSSLHSSPLHEGNDMTQIDFSVVPQELVVGEHTITFQIREDGTWSGKESAPLTVSDRTGSGGGPINANFMINPNPASIGTIATFVACSEPCVEGDDTTLSYSWKMKLDSTDDWIDLGNDKEFTYADLVEGNHVVNLTVTDTSTDDSGSHESNLIVMPALPIIKFSSEFGDSITLKEELELELVVECMDYLDKLQDCSYEWKVWGWVGQNDPSLVFSSSVSDTSNHSKFFINTMLCKEPGTDGVPCNSDNSNYDKIWYNLTKSGWDYYQITLVATDSNGTNSEEKAMKVYVHPPNVAPSAVITISPPAVSVSWGTSEYYKDMNLTFSSTGSSDSDGQVVAYNWYYNETIVSQEHFWTSSFDVLGSHYILLEVQDDNGLWSTSRAMSSFKIIENTPPAVDFNFTWSEDFLYVFNSTTSDTEGSVVAFEWYLDTILISEEENATWLANLSGEHTIMLRVIDDGGMWASTSKTFTVDDSGPQSKIFAAEFSSTDLKVGDALTINFSKTRGGVDFYQINVTNPSGVWTIYDYKPSSEAYQEKTISVFTESGSYTIDTYVFWADGVAREGLADWQGTKVFVASDTQSSNITDNLPQVEDNPLPAMSVISSFIVITILATIRRYR